jgi:DNA-binding transcriptional regulator YhcF (GntR family)
MRSVGTRQSAAGHSLAGVEALADQLHLPVEQVARAYLRELARLESEARIKNFVSVLALGAVRTRLREPRNDA